jgi:hypothetical protein
LLPSLSKENGAPMVLRDKAVEGRYLESGKLEELLFGEVVH